MENKEVYGQCSKPVKDTCTLDTELGEICLATVDKDEPNGSKENRRNLLIKLMLVMFAFYPQGCCGLLMGMCGPAFLDLILITNSNIEEASVFFTAQYLGITVSCAVVGTLYDRFQTELLMLLSICLTGAINIAIPYCSSSIWLMAVVNGFRGVTMGIILTGCGVIVVRVCGKKDGGPYMQALHFAYSVGGVIAPFIVRPFLAPRQELVINNGTSNETLTMLDKMASTHKTVNNITVVEYFGETHVRYSFIIVGIITFLSALPFLMMIIRRYHVTPDYWKMEKKKEHGQKPETDPEITKMLSETNERRLTTWLRIVFLVFIVLYFILIVAVETLFENYTMTFVVKGLKWTKTRGTQISSVFWGAFSFGRFQGIFTAKILTAWKILFLDFLFLSVSVVALLIGAERSNPVVWIFMAVAGVSIGSLFAGGVSYTEQRIMAITGKVYGICVMAATAGGMINPLIVGTLIEKYSPMWFVYFSVIITALCVILFAIMTIMVIKWGKKADPKDDGLLDKAIGRCISKFREASTD